MFENDQMRKILRYWLLLLLAVAGRLLPAQNSISESLTIADGLSQGMIYDIEQSDDGFLWFATKDGLNRYDGYRFEVFTNDPFNPFSIAGNDVQSIFEDSRGNLWLSIFGKGLDVLEKNSGRFFHLPFDVPPSVTETSDSTIWVGTSKGILRLHWRHTNFDVAFSDLSTADLTANLTMEETPIRLSSPYLPLNLMFEPDGSLLISDFEDGLYRYVPSTEALTLLDTTLLAPQCQIANGVLATGPDGVYLIEKGSLPRRLKLDLMPAPFSTSRVFSDWQGNFIIATTSLLNGSCFFKVPETELLQNGEPKGIEKIFCFELFTPWSEVDRSGNLWVGTSGYGLRKINLGSLPFQHLLPGHSIRQIVPTDKGVSLPGNLALDLMLSGTGDLVKTTVKFQPITALKWIKQTEDGTIYLIGTVQEQDVLGIQKSAEMRLLELPKTVGEVGYLFVDSKGLVWIGALESRLMCYLPEKDRIVIFDFSPKIGKVSEVFALYEDAQGNLWVGTDKGVLKLDIGKLDIGAMKQNAAGEIISPFQLSQYQTIPTDPKSLRHNFVTAFCADPHEPDRYLWLSTKGGGLNMLELATGKFTHFTSQNSGLPNDVVYGILPENTPLEGGQKVGNIWGSTNRGLFRLTIGRANSQQPEANRSYRFRNFREFDGLQSDEFNTRSFAKGKDRRLYFGGVNGLTVFDPAAIIDRKTDATVLLTGLKINNLTIDYFTPLQGSKGVSSPLDRPIHRAKSLRLKHTENTVTLDFALTDFVNPKENRYRYRLSGIDGDWVEAGVNHTATYTDLRPGSYSFEVQGNITGGEWCTSTILTIKVLPPYWATWWAYVLYVLALGAASYLFYKNRLRQKMEHQESLRLRELDEFKSRFFTNITHEFRTPLTVILGNLEIEKLEIEKLGKPETPKISQFLNFLISKNALTHRNAESLLRLINQILDLAKLESNSLKINYIQADVLPYLRYIAESLHSFANAQNVMLRVESTEAQIIMDYDPEQLLQIVHNLLSNAIKFTPSGGKVTLRADFRNLKDFGNLLLSVSDTGVGIPAADLPKIFDRFYQANTPPIGGRGAAKAGGTGIGLSLTKELVRAMGGDISVESELNKGTTCTVRLPITNRSERREVRSEGSQTGNMMNDFTAPSSPLTSHPSLLIIEDNSDVVEYIAACLGEKYQLDFAYNGRAGIEKALETVPDLIISDVMMPEKDGFEVCDILKNDERTSHVPIVLLTAKADMESRIAGLKRGADAYLAKPFHQEELLVTLQNLLELRRKLQAKYAEIQLAAVPLVPIPDIDLEDIFLKKLRLCIEENLGDTAFDSGRLAKAMKLSDVQLYRKIKALTDKSTAIYIRSIRLQKGRELLQTTQMNVSEIAYEVGFDDPNYFSRTFSQEFGVAPSEVRK